MLSRQTKHRLTFALLMAALMTGVVSFVLTALNFGMDAQFLSRWLISYAVACASAAPIIYFAAPAVRAWIERNIS